MISAANKGRVVALRRLRRRRASRAGRLRRVLKRSSSCTSGHKIIGSPRETARVSSNSGHSAASEPVMMAARGIGVTMAMSKTRRPSRVGASRPLSSAVAGSDRLTHSVGAAKPSQSRIGPASPQIIGARNSCSAPSSAESCQPTNTASATPATIGNNSASTSPPSNRLTICCCRAPTVFITAHNVCCCRARWLAVR